MSDLRDRMKQKTETKSNPSSTSASPEKTKSPSPKPTATTSKPRRSRLVDSNEGNEEVMAPTPRAPKKSPNELGGKFGAMNAKQQKMMLGVGGVVFMVIVVFIAITLSGNEEKNPSESVENTSATVSSNPDKPWLNGGTAQSDPPKEEEVVEEQNTSVGDKPWLESGSQNEILEPLEPVVGEAVELTEEQLIQAELEAIGIGVRDLSKDTVWQNTSEVESDTFLRDLRGEDVPELWSVDKIVTISGYVTYTKHRAITADGIELYWLEGTFKGKPCKIQVSYSIFKELDPEDVVPVDVEIVKTTDGGIISTYFTVRPDYKSLLDGNTNKE